MPRLHQDESRRAAERPHMSTGESDYAKRVVELSMQLANSRADVENLRMRIKAVDKEHEQLKKDRADMVDRFDAALRRAKAEGMREASDMVEDDCYALSESDVSDPTHAAKVLHNVNQQALSNKIDARAAQIEEGRE